MADLFGLWAAPAILALIPALFRLRRARILARHLDDPAFPERLQGSRTPMTAVFAAVVAIEAVAWPGRAWWSLPLLLLAFMAAGWPLRRRMFGETWSVGAYVWFYVRLIAAIYGFWLLMIAAPWLTRFGGPAWIAPAIVALILIAWNEEYGAVVRRILGARPLAPSRLLERCRTIVARSHVVNANIEYVPMHGGVLINAIALPHLRRPTVLFSGSLIDRFDEDEVTAVCAHEVAHLEHFNPRRLRKLRLVGWGMIAVAVMIGPLVRVQSPRFEWLLWLWPFVVASYLSILTAARQKHETESDRRGIALGGDPEAMIRGLVKLYALARMPRRLDPNLEVNASHPSLARRIQAIRAAAGVTVSSLGEPVVLQSGSTRVTLHADRLEWAEGDGTSYSLPYSTLDELRVEAGEGAAKLSVGDAQGRRWTTPLADADVARAQAALDVVDARIRPAPAGVGVWRTLAVLVNLLVVVAALAAGQLAATVVALLASFSVEKPLMRAAGAAGLVGAAIALRDGGAREMALILMAGAALLLFIAFRDQRDTIGRWTRYGMPAIGALAVLSLLPFAFATSGFLAAHQIANRWPSAAVLSLAFAAAAAWPRRTRWRMAALAAVIAAVMVLVVGDTRTLDAALGDPFLQRVGAPPVARISGAPVSRTQLPFTPSRVLVSPRGESVAALVESDEYREASCFIGRAGGALVEVHADSARFVDERRVLVTDPSGTGTRLRLIDTDRPNASVWESSFDVEHPSISLDRQGLRWRLLGAGADGGIVQITGAMDGGSIDRQAWKLDADPVHQPLWPLSVTGSRVLVSMTDYDSSLYATLGAWAYWLRPFNSTTKFGIVDGTRLSDVFRSRLHLQCEPGAFTDEGPICSAHDGSRFHVAALSTMGDAVTPLAKFHRAMTFHVTPGWITGFASLPFALDRATGSLVMPDGAGGRSLYMITGSEESIGVVLWNQSDMTGTVLEIYRRSAILDQRLSARVIIGGLQ